MFSGGIGMELNPKMSFKKVHRKFFPSFFFFFFFFFRKPFYPLQNYHFDNFIISNIYMLKVELLDTCIL